MNAMFEIVESDVRGKKKAVATRDLPAGVELVVESPIVSITKNENHPKYSDLETKTGIQSIFWAMYDAFHQVSPTSRERCLALFQLTSSADTILQGLSNVDCKQLCLDREEFAAFVMVLRYNVVPWENQGFAVYDIGSNWHSSCLPNCSRTEGNPQRTIRTIRDVRKGDDLTVCFDEDFTLNPTNERRTKNLRARDFLCNCERCTSFADDTRRFACQSTASKSSTQCAGYHCVCQSTAEDTPFLLPCTVCKLRPTAEWERSMLILEQLQLAKIPKGGPTQGFLQRVVKSRSPRVDIFIIPPEIELDDPLLSAEPLPLPLHYSAAYFLEIKMCWALSQFNGSLAARFGRELMALYDSMIKFPHTIHYTTLLNLGITAHAVHSIESIQVSLVAFRQASRLMVSLYGKMLPLNITAIMRSLTDLKKLGQPAATASLDQNCCALCEMSPSHFPINLSKCGRCKKVQYCGRDCQVAHWKLHKDTCKPG